MDKVVQGIDQIAHVALTLGVIIILFVTCIDFHCFDRGFFKEQYHKLNTAESLGMVEDDLMSATTTLLDYLQNKRDDISVTVVISGNKQEAFNAKEAAHMVDVRDLYQTALLVRSIAMVFAFVSLIYLWITKRKTLFMSLSVTYIKVAIVFGFALGLLAIWAIADFNSFWTIFHEVLFDNDLWLLDPRTDLMINLFPSPFFFALVMRIVISFVTFFVGILIASIIYLKRIVKKGYQ